MTGVVKKMLGKVAIGWALIYAVYALGIRPWYRRHRRDADYWMWMGYLVGLVGTVIMILIVEATQ